MEDRERFYAACARGGAPGAQAHALMSMSVAAQARFSEVIGLHEPDVVLRRDLGILISVILDKTHKMTLNAYPRVCARYPGRFLAHDAFFPVSHYLATCAGRDESSLPVPGRPFFTKLVCRADGSYAAGTEPLDADYARALLLRFLKAADIADADALLNFSLHFARTSGFSDLANKMFLGRLLAAEAGGWAEGGCVAESYQRRTAEDLASALHISLVRVGRDLRW